MKEIMKNLINDENICWLRFLKTKDFQFPEL